MTSPGRMSLEEGRGLALLDSSNWQQVLVCEEPSKRRKSDVGRFVLGGERQLQSDDTIVASQDTLLENAEKENVSIEEEKKSTLRDQFANKLNSLNKRPPIIKVACYEDKNGKEFELNRRNSLRVVGVVVLLWLLMVLTRCLV